MNRDEFGRLVATLRTEIIDLNTGRPMTQSSLATLANLPTRTIGQIEQGQKMNLDPQTLHQLVGALRLTTLEHKALLAAAAEVDIEPFSDIKQPDAILNDLLTSTQTLCLPAMIYDSYFNIIAGNTLMFALSNASDELIETGEESPAGFNLLRYIFADSSSYRHVAGPEWKLYGRRNVQHFRSASLKYRYTERFKAIFTDLCRNLAFQEAWVGSKYTERDLYYPWNDYEYIHPIYGPLNYISSESVTFTSAEDLFLVTHIPRNWETIHTFEQIGREKGLHMHRFTSWPYDEV